MDLKQRGSVSAFKFGAAVAELCQMESDIADQRDHQLGPFGYQKIRFLADMLKPGPSTEQCRQTNCQNPGTERVLLLVGGEKIADFSLCLEHGNEGWDFEITRVPRVDATA